VSVEQSEELEESARLERLGERDGAGELRIAR
jgi:hypothetical protein